MKRLLPIVMLVSAWASFMSNSALAQQSQCITQADSVSLYLAIIRDHFRWTDSATTLASGEPWSSQSQIRLVTNRTTCRSGVDAFNRVSGASGTPQAESQAMIFSLGGTGYAYVRPGDGTNGMRSFYIFKSNWTFRAAMVSPH